MRPDIEQLIQLQHIDNDISKLLKEANRIPLDKEQAKSRLDQSQAALDQSLQEKKENELAIKSLELDIETRKNTISRLKQQQFETKKNEEYHTLGKEVERYSDMIDELETQELELLEKTDVIQLDIDKKKAARDEIQSGIDQEIGALDSRLEKVNESSNVQKEKRNEHSSNIDPELLELYDRLLKNKDGLALAQISDTGQCNGCHIKLTPASQIAVQAEKEIVQCENCGRLAYL